jgi:predicted amidohydrolase
VVVAGLCERGEDGAVFNSAVVLDDSGLRAAYRKAHLWDTEKLVFQAGDAPPPVVTVAGVRLGVLICYDLEFPEWVRLAALAGAQLLCVPTNWPRFPRPDGQRPIEVVRAQAAASVNRMFVAACDRVGAERGVDWVGGSVIVDADGWPLAGPNPGDDELLLTADCRLDDAMNKAISDRNDVFADRRTELYGATEKGWT